MGLLLAETSVALDLPFFEENGTVFSVLHHDTQARGVGYVRVDAIRSAN